MRSGLALLALSLCSLAYASPKDSRDGGSGNDADEQSSGVSPTATAGSSSSTATSNPQSAALVGMNGDSTCTDLMCIGVLVNGSTVQYTLQSLGQAKLGWMAMGFGAQMTNSPMVIMWPNSDGSITLSQRKAPGEVMPSVDSNPPRQATLEASLSSLSGPNPKLVYTIPANSDTKQSVIWAFGITNPGSSAVDASLLQHLNSGPTQLNLGNALSASSRDPTNPISTISGGSSSGSTGGGGSGGGSFSVPLLPYQKMIVAHAVLCVIGFLGLLPAGALLARYLRTYSNTWFTGHWIFQFALAGPVIVIGVALGFASVHSSGAPHLDDDHKGWGIGIFVLYLFQLVLGAVIHYIKPKSFTVTRRRPVQNYAHAVLGLITIAFALYQVRNGFRTEWPAATGRGSVGNGANIIWYIWVVLLPVLYFAGLLLLKRQFQQERGVKVPPSISSDTEVMNMDARGGQYRDEPDRY